VFGVSQTLALCVGNHGNMAHRLTHNGTAVEGVCVTGEASRVPVPFVSSETVPVARQYGAIFAPDSYRDTVRVGFITIAVQVVC